MNERFARTAMLLGENGIDILSKKKVAVFGCGGVGGYVCEGLVRSGIGALSVIDNDTVNITNINRQIIATSSTIGMNKVDVIKSRMNDINPDLDITAYNLFYLPENAEAIDFTEFDYIVDAVDTVTAKILIITRAKKFGVPVISCMGTGNKLDPSKLEITDLYKTDTDPLAKILRNELKKRGVNELKTVFSREKPITPKFSVEGDGENGRHTPGSSAFVPGAAGLLIASEVVKDLLSEKDGEKDGNTIKKSKQNRDT
jgi:tRNA A37 threonylcarbamoyladenosine dehydratase